MSNEKLSNESKQWLNMCSDCGSDDDIKYSKEILSYIEHLQENQKEMVEWLIKIMNNFVTFLKELTYN